MKINKTIAKPFLKWAGGKTQLLSEIDKKINYSRDESFTYIEPFVGSGAVLFWMLNNYPNIKKVVINDVNTDLINCYWTIKNDVLGMVYFLQELEKEYNILTNNPEKRKLVYYDKRTLFNRRISNQIEQSALFIFLNRTCFNGLYRVNRKNEFNVPQGSYKKPQICNSDNLKIVSEMLQKVEILNRDFSETIEFANKNSFFYFDPPYKPLSETSNFNSYSKDEFDDSEQIRLKEFCDQLDVLGSQWILSNSDVKGKNPDNNFFDDLFKNYHINRVLAKRSINANPDKRGQLTELLITNNKNWINNK
ncbi:MAG: DNA adenine methylase [Bacteroidales bacterium]|nr:DNA adenine methylase [Bacteroidales bacterium]